MKSQDLQYNTQSVFTPDVDFLTPSYINRLSSGIRIQPDFFIGGVQKGGTTSLYYSLIQHPQIIPAKFKELFYYGNDVNYAKGQSYYKQFFATGLYKKLKEFQLHKKVLTLDASTNTIDNPKAPERILGDNPDAKLIFILRNPADRAFSHYKMAVKRGWELADFETALSLEEQRIQSGSLQNASHNYAYYRLGYKSRGLYVNQLKTWFAKFPSKNLLILTSEEFFAQPESIYKQICTFLEIEAYPQVKFEKMNEGHSEKMKPETRQLLNDYYQPFNKELSQLLKRNFNWD